MTSSIAVITPAYNAEDTLPEAVASILASTLPLHLVVVDDGSQIAVEDVLATAYGAGIPANVTVIRSTINQGVACARNLALQWAIQKNYDYVALLDADDIAYPERFAKQVAFLDANPNVAAVGTWGNAVDERNVMMLRAYPLLNREGLRRAMCFDNYIINSSAMLRVNTLPSGGWDESLRTGEDYDMFCRLVRHHDLAVIPEVLIDFRLLSSGLSISSMSAQRRSRLRIQLRNVPYRYYYWQAWVGILISIVRIMIPNSMVENFKKMIGRDTMFEVLYEKIK